MKQTIILLLLSSLLSRCSPTTTSPNDPDNLPENLVEGSVHIQEQLKGGFSHFEGLYLDESINLPKTEDVFEFERLAVHFEQIGNFDDGFTGYEWFAFISTLGDDRFTQPRPLTELNLAPPYNENRYESFGYIFRFLRSDISVPPDSTTQAVLFYVTPDFKNYGRLVATSTYNISVDQDSITIDLEVDFSYMVLTDSSRTFPSL